MPTVYFYHTQDLTRIYPEWKQGIFPGHLMYGATHLHKHGFDVVMHPRKAQASHWRLMLLTTWTILTCRRRFDVLYATSFRGLELIVLLRALRLFRRPVVLWHHQAVRPARNPLRERVARFWYRGIDCMFFFSRKLMADSLKSRKARPERMELAHWGADLDFYDRLTASEGFPVRRGFISTGKERRDMPTLLQAFGRSGAPLDIYVPDTCGGINYHQVFGSGKTPDNVHIHFMKGLIPYELSKEVCRAACVVICCQETDYTVGLTTVVEALALGIPLICSRNPQFEMDIDAAGVGITVPYGDAEAWAAAVRRLTENPEEAEGMGRNARRLAEETFNLERCAAEVAAVLRRFVRG